MRAFFSLRETSSGILARLKGPVTGGVHSHDHADDDFDEAANRGLLGIAWFAFILGFAHEEEFAIIGLCAGSNYCLKLMSAYAITVILGIVGLTMLCSMVTESFIYLPNVRLVMHSNYGNAEVLAQREWLVKSTMECREEPDLVTGRGCYVAPWRVPAR